MRLLLTFALLLSLCPQLMAQNKNILLIIADDLGLQVGCYGDKLAKTPHIDALAATGTRFTNAFASVASCSPSRATILTGLPTHQSGQYGLAHDPHNIHTLEKVRSLPALLQAKGYRTAVISKLHVLPKSVYPLEEIKANGRNPVAVADAARKFITQSSDKPFFLLVGFTDPHRGAVGFGNEAKMPPTVPKVQFDPKQLPLPYHLPDNEDTRNELAEYYQSVSRMDHGVGLLMKVLEETKHVEDTLVIFLSDNGIPFPGAKTTLYDSGLHLPLIMRGPGTKQVKECDTLVSWTDIAPTVLKWAGVEKPLEQKGISLLSMLKTSQDDSRTAIYGSHQFHEITMYYPMRMVRTRDYKLIHNLAHPLPYPFASDLFGSAMWQSLLQSKATMMGKRAVKDFLQRPEFELYDMRNDPEELKNLASDAKHEKTLKTLQTLLQNWRQETMDPWLKPYH